MKAKPPRSCLAVVVLMALPCTGVFYWVDSRTTYYLSAYRIASLVDAGSNERLRDRLYPVRFDSCTIEFEWYTYDNSDITVGPYKLFLVAIPRDPRLKSVTVRLLDMTSSRGKVYDLGPADDSRIKIVTRTWNERVTGKMGRAFPFDFDAGEVISTRLLIEFDLGDARQMKEITLEWKPVRVRYWASIV